MVTRESFSEDWRDKAACRGLTGNYPFYPEYDFERKAEKENREARAKAICGMCAVREACLDFALRTREKDGIWGGLTEGERKVILGVYTR